MACDCCHSAPRRGQPLFVRVPPSPGSTRVRLPAGRYFQYWNATSGQVRMTAEYGGETVALPNVLAFQTSPIYLNPFADDGYLVLTEAVASVGQRGWIIVSGD